MVRQNWQTLHSGIISKKYQKCSSSVSTKHKLRLFSILHHDFLEVRKELEVPTGFTLIYIFVMVYQAVGTTVS